MAPKPDDEEETEAERRAANIVLLVGAVILIGGGIWLVNALVDARKSEECFESSRADKGLMDCPPRLAPRYFTRLQVSLWQRTMATQPCKLSADALCKVTVPE
jgi:hypothetical protein